MKFIKLRRLGALCIDFIISVVFATQITNIVTLGHFNLKAPFVLQCISIIVYLIINFILIIYKDLTFRNASIGKKILKLAIYHTDGSIPSKKTIIKRITSDIITFPLDILGIIFKNKTSGDKEYNTIVTNIKTNKK